MQTRIHARPVAGFTLGSHSESLIQELERTSVGLLLIFPLQGVREFQQCFKASALAHHKVTKMRRQCRHEMKRIETFGQNFVKCSQRSRIVAFQEGIHKRKAILIVQDVEIAQDILIFHIRAAEGHSLVEYGKSVTHSPVSLVRDHVQRLVVNGHALAGGHHTEVLHDIVNSDPVEVIRLAAREYGRKDLVFLGGGKDEYSVCRRFLQCLEESIEGSLGQHMHLVYDIYAVPSHLRRYAHLVHKGLDVFDSVVGGCIKLVDAVRASLGE